LNGLFNPNGPPYEEKSLKMLFAPKGDPPSLEALQIESIPASSLTSVAKS
jgi:hypothetical protein